MQHFCSEKDKEPSTSIPKDHDDSTLEVTNQWFVGGAAGKYCFVGTASDKLLHGLHCLVPFWTDSCAGDIYSIHDHNVWSFECTYLRWESRYGILARKSKFITR
jgi:hypothetical protein